MLVNLSKITKIFDVNKHNICILKELSLTLSKSSSLAIVGPSGSGKSTLLNIISGLERPTSGSVVVLEKNLGILNDSELANFRLNNIGFIFQNFNLLESLNIRDNITLPAELLKLRYQSDFERLVEVLGIEPILTKYSYNCSGGECQRVAIARALLSKPKLIIADEPTGSLDRETGGRIEDLLFSLIANTESSLLLVTHDLELASKCNSKFTLAGGNLI